MVVEKLPRIFIARRSDNKPKHEFNPNCHPHLTISANFSNVAAAQKNNLFK